MQIFEAALDTKEHHIKILKSDANSDEALETAQLVMAEYTPKFMDELLCKLKGDLPPEIWALVGQ